MHEHRSRTLPLTRHQGESHLRPFIDAAVIGSILVISGYLFRKGDPGFLELNPTPWIFLPIFLAVRYSFWHGMAGSAIAILSTLMIGSRFGDTSIAQTFNENQYLCLLLFVCSGISSMARHLLTDDHSDLSPTEIELTENISDLRSTISLYRENEILLRRSLLLHNAEFVSLPEQLVKLFQGSEVNVANSLLHLLDESFGVKQAAFYEISRGDRLNRISDREEESENFPDFLSPNTPIISESIRTGQIVTTKALWKSGVQSDYLAVIPSIGAKAFLVIRRMDFDSITWESFARIEALLNWTASRLTYTHDPSQDFASQIRHARWMRDEMGIPGRLICFPESDVTLISKLESVAEPHYCVGVMNHTPFLLITESSIANANIVARKLTARIGAPDTPFKIIELEDAGDITTKKINRANLDDH